jgi:type IV secretion system protein VirD4
MSLFESVRLFVGWLLDVVIFCAMLAAVAFVQFKLREKREDNLAKIPTYMEYVPKWARKNALSVGLSTLLFLLWGPWWAGALLLLTRLKLVRKKGFKVRSEKELQADPVNATVKWLASLGADHAQRVKAIESLFEERTTTISATDYLNSSSYLAGVESKRYVFFEVSRSLAGMSNREREYMRIAELLTSVTDGKESAYRKWRAALLWGDGKGKTRDLQWYNMPNQETGEAAVRVMIRSVDQTINEMQEHLANLRGRPALEPKFRALLEDSTERLTTGGSSWLKPGQIATTLFAPSSDFPLHIGSFSDGTPLTYSGDGSLVTIAPPGSGKTQCNVFPNLLTWSGPAVVLDISGDIYEHTAAWRAANVGPVYKFSPLEPEGSHSYNPLTFVRREPDYLWEDSRMLAEMMIVPSSSADPFWENEARTALTAAIAYVCYSNAPEQRPMHAVLDVLFGGKPWDQMVLGLRMAIDVRVMTQHAASLSAMNEKTLSSVLQTARSSLGAWSGERVARVTAKSDWSPLDLRGSTNPTIYIYIRPNEVEAYLSLLRVFIGQHIRMLTGGAVPLRGAPPILFMLDELPRLRHMPPVDEALNIGRKYGLRLWMFAQSVGQLKTAYENADGMLGSCAVRIFMNPSGADGLTERLSEEIGYVDSLNDSSRKRFVEGAELGGPAFRDQQIVLALGTKPAKVSKDFAWRDSELKKRMSTGGVIGAKLV